MTDANVTTPTENVGRGVALAALTIPIAIGAFAILGGAVGIITGIVAIVVPFISAGLYAKGAGAPLSRAGWGPWIGVTTAAVVIGTLSGVVASIYNGFSSVGGDGGLLGSTFLTTLRTQLTTNFADHAFGLIIGLGLGAAGIYRVVKGPQTAKPGALAQENMPSSLGGPGTAPSATPTPTSPSAPAPSTPPAANTPSPGIMLNGKPLDPDTK